MLAFWVFVGIPVAWLLQKSVPFLVLLSVYAIIVGHWSGWSAERPTETIDP